MPEIKNIQETEKEENGTLPALVTALKKTLVLLLKKSK